MRRSRRPPTLVRILSPLRDFLALEASGAILLALAAVTALVWANSPWSAAYDDLWSAKAAVSVAGHHLELDLRGWVNDGLMTVFFLVVGLEIKREISAGGHLASRRAALLPAMAAVGGMLLPAALYLAIAGRVAPGGWAIPMATDIALAVGVLAVAGRRLPPSLRAFLLALAIVDDIGAIVVIAVAYSTGIGFDWLALAVLLVGVTLLARRIAIHRTWVYVAIGAGVWFALHEAHVHPTIAGVVLGLLAPSTPRLDVDLIDDAELVDLSDVDAARTTSALARGSVSVVEWLQHVLHPWTSFVVVPVFALANAGIPVSVDALSAAARSPITWGVIAGLVVGKPLGIVLATRIATRTGVADEPPGATPRQVVGIGTTAGIGFTVALFVTELAFDAGADRDHAKLAILVASIIAAALGAFVLTRGPEPEASQR